MTSLMERYAQIIARRTSGFCYRRECNLPRSTARGLAMLHRAHGYTARIRMMRTKRGLYNVYLDHYGVA